MSTTTSNTTPPRRAAAFAYGFDLTSQEPGATGNPVPAATTSARDVLARFAGSYVDQSMYGFGVGTDPEPLPGVFDMAGLSSRLSLITAAGGIPVVTLIGAPPWMRGGRSGGRRSYRPPDPSHYEAFAALCAHVAKAFPQVRYFVVWNELKGFWDPATKTWNAVAYTQLYNDVYASIKAVRPTAMVGGPYAALSATRKPVRRLVSTVHGPYGYLDQGMLDAVSYWLGHNLGADFIAVDGATANAKAGIQVENAVTAATQYAAVDAWIRSKTALPIWWMESHIAPSGWTAAQGGAARVATLAEMASSGAAVGMQWQPQDEAGWADEGLWTSTLSSEGGQETTLAFDLLSALPVLEHAPTVVQREPPGVLVASDPTGTVACNTNSVTAIATVGGRAVALAPGEVLVH